MPTFKTVEGIEVEYGPISLAELEMAEKAIEREYRERGEPIDPPTYEVEVAGGGKVKHFHDENSDKDDAAQAEWLLHKDALNRMQGDQTAVRSQMIFEGIKVQLPEDDAWMRRQKKYRIPIPEDPEERLTHYIMTVIFKAPSDVMDISMEIMRLSAKGLVPREAIDAAEATFRRKLEREAVAFMETQGKQPVELFRETE